MCIAVPAKIDFINDDEAIVNYGGVKMNVNIKSTKRTERIQLNRQKHLKE